MVNLLLYKNLSQSPLLGINPHPVMISRIIKIFKQKQTIMRTSTRCNRNVPRGRTRFASSVTVLLTLFLLFFVSTNVSAQCGTCGTPTGTIVVDGNPCDWRNANLSLIPGIIRSYQADPFGNGVLDNQFTEGSKDFLPASDLRWVIGQTKAKNDIANAAVAIYNGVLYFAGDRTSNNGDAQIGFWFYLNGTAPVVQPDGTQNFAPEHAVGDILVLADFTGGGATANVSIYKWVGTGGDVPNTNGTLSSVTTCSNVIVAQNNSTAYPHPAEWSFENPCYDVNEFYEGQIPLSCLISAGVQPCFGSFLLETRSSQSITASLDDFVASGFDARPHPTASAVGTNPTCFGASNGSIDLTVGGTGSNPTYVWTKVGGSMPAGQANVQDPSGLSAGTYNVVVTVQGAVAACTATATAQAILTNPTQLTVSASAVGTNPTCFGASNGSIALTVATNDGTPTFAWTKVGGGFTSAVEDPTGLSAGTYNVVVTVGNSTCSATATAQAILTNPTQLTVSASAVGTNPTCFGASNGSIALTAATNDGTPTYAWTKVGGGFTSAVEDPTGLSAGTYNVVVTVGNSTCSATATAQAILTNPAQLTVSASAVGSGPSCFGASDGSIALTVATNDGTPTYAWTKVGGGFTSAVEDPTGLSAGTYNVLVTVGNSTCSATATAQAILTNPTQITASASAVGTNPTCFGASNGSIALTATTNGGTPTFAWTKVGGGFTSAVEDPTGLSAGTYNVLVTVGSGSCTATATAQAILTNPAQLTVSASAVGTNPTCFGASNGSIALTATTNGGTPTFAWTKVGGGFTSAVEDPTGLSAGTYNVLVTVGNSTCSATATAQAILTNPAQLTVSASAVATNSTCGGSNGSINLTVSTNDGTPTFAWSKVGGGFSSSVEDPANLSAGTYNVTVTVGNSTCSATATAQAIVTTTNCDVLCTYTQGQYGTEQGMACDGTTAPNMFTTFQTIQNSINNQGGAIVIGGATRSVRVTSSTTDVNEVIDVLPGNGGSEAFTHSGQISITALPSSYLTKQGRINNQLFSQTLTLSINMGIKPGLGTFALQADKWLVTADVVECGSSTIKPCQFACTPNLAIPGTYIWTVTYSPYQSFEKIPTTLYNALGTKDVAGLLALANAALNGNALPAGVTLEMITSAVDMINNAFDECRSFVGWFSGATAPTANSFCSLPSSTTPCPVSITTTRRATDMGTGDAMAANGVQVSAYPNPFNDVVKFTIQSNVSGKAQLVVYNALGQRVKTIYNGYIQANKSQMVEYKTPSPSQGNLFYILTIGGKQATGKLLRMD
jgi:large repetitive protein